MSNAPTRPRFDKHRDLVLEAKKGTHAARQRWPEGGGGERAERGDLVLPLG